MSCSTTTNAVLIELKNINQFMGPQHNQQHVLKDINLSIEQGEYIAIIGQSGSGKSTLMNLLGCLDLATSGEIFFRGQAISRLCPDDLAELRLKSFGFVFQRYNLLNSLSALENVLLPAVYLNLDVQTRQARAMKLLKALDLPDKYNSRSNQLSGGQQQRISIARALMNGGEVILADEPTGALDSKSGEIVLQILEKLHQQGHTIILVTHDPQVAKRANRVIEIKDGTLLSDQKKSDQIPAAARIDKLRPVRKFSWLTQFFAVVKMSIHSIWLNRLRAFLTMLGMIIGICSVTMIVALGNGTRQKFLHDWNGFTQTTLTIYPGQNDLDASSSRLNFDDITALKDVAEVMHISPYIGTSGKLIYANRSLAISAQGADDYGLKIFDLSLAHGRFITQNDVKTAAKVIVIDEQAAQKLFLQHKAALHQTVLLNKQLYEVVGVVKNNYSNGAPSVWIPNTTLQRQMSRLTLLSGMIVVLRENALSKHAEDQIRKILIARHQIEDFQIFSSDEALKTLEKYMNTISYFIFAVAFISLVVGGIGVMNMMLVAVTERIKEIGLKMAIGAKKHDIRMQFLIEAMVLCLLGGVIGVTLTFIACQIFNFFSSEYKMIFSWWIPLSALIFASVIGLMFGYLPANRAANLKPVEALMDK